VSKGYVGSAVGRAFNRAVLIGLAIAGFGRAIETSRWRMFGKPAQLNGIQCNLPHRWMIMTLHYDQGVG